MKIITIIISGVQGNKVYMREKNNCSDPEYVIYDFGLEVGDTMTLQFFNGVDFPTPIQVESVDTINYFGVNRKTLTIIYDRCGGEMGAFDSATMQWIEGIGSDTHPFYAIFCYCDGCEFWSNLVCYDSSGVQLYGTPDVDACDIIIDVPTLTSKSPKIFPNPVSELLFFEPGNSAEYFYSIRSITNNIVIKNSNSELLELNVEELSPGIYFFELLNSEGQRITAEKFVKL